LMGTGIFWCWPAGSILITHLITSYMQQPCIWTMVKHVGQWLVSYRFSLQLEYFTKEYLWWREKNMLSVSLKSSCMALVISIFCLVTTIMYKARSQQSQSEQVVLLQCCWGIGQAYTSTRSGKFNPWFFFSFCKIMPAPELSACVCFFWKNIFG
jgi:hypothetical protein